jgi:hypothetical protein
MKAMYCLQDITEGSPLATRLRNRCGGTDIRPAPTARAGRSIMRRSAAALAIVVAAPFALAGVVLMACASLPMFAAGCFRE